MPFCYSPWTNIDINPNGNIAPCCKFRLPPDDVCNIQTHSINDYTNSNLLKNLKEEFNQGSWPQGCERCQIEETNGIQSKRQLDNIRWADQYQHYKLSDQSKFITASLAFGNTCNLTCITCGPNASSRWQREYQMLHGIDIKPFHFYKKDFVTEFIAQAPGIIHIDIPGGEPFLSGVTEQKQMLEFYIQSGQASSISLHYTTNGTVFPDVEWWTLWKSFKEIDIQLSVDGVGTRYEYIRYPGVWTEFVLSVNKYQTKLLHCSNLKLSVSHTVSAYNIFYLDEFFTWCYTIGLPRPWLGKVHAPEYMRPSVWPGRSRIDLIEKLANNTDSDIQAWGKLIKNTDDTHQFEKFKEYTMKHDAFRQTSFAKTFPDLVKYL